ncbi:MAG: hypothetical protein B7Z80_04495 [Rhodospirillales bacterium 20-64-7]|nr:MAG: hypothetical protein B7Z80_04495 [Rhodospirillales bacterium 20-64-7]
MTLYKYVGLSTAFVIMVTAGVANADPWVPAAGSGSAKLMVRLFNANHAYPGTGFGSGTIPASKQNETQIRITGVQGIGDGISIEYDLRAGRKQDSSTKHGITTSLAASGLEDQEVGLNYGLIQSPLTALSTTLNVIVPTGSSHSNPAMGTGHLAIEPDMQAGFKTGPFTFTGELGARIFTDSGVTQLRGTLYAGWHILPRLTLFSTGFASRTLQNAASLTRTDQSEVYNIVRVGGGAEFKLTAWLRPYVEYEHTIAGQGIHAGDRITLGVSVAF